MGTVTGTVLSAPRCPGPERLGSPCPPGPVDGAVVEALRGSVEIASTRSDQDGKFQMTLPVGRYLIRATNVGGLRTVATKTAVVGAGGTVRLMLVVDSGIR